MKMNFSFSRLLENNKVIRILSVLIAIIAWLIVSITIDDNQITRIDNIPLTIDMTNTAPNSLKLSLIEGENQTVSVKVEGIRYKLGNLTKDDFIATPVLSSVKKVGEQEVKIEVHKIDATDNSYQITSHTESVKLTFDRVGEKTFDLIPVADNVKAGSGFRKDQITATPKQITVNGPQSEVDLISKCCIEYHGNEIAFDTLVVNGDLVFYDKDNNKLLKTQIPHIYYDEQEFSITIPIFMQKTVPVKVSFINTNGVDTSKLKYELTINELSIAGPRDVIEKRQDVTIGPIDFSKIDLESAFTFDVQLEAGIINENDINQIMVYIITDDMSKKTLNVEKENILLKNIPTGFNARIESKDIKNVKMIGDKANIENLTSKELIAWADLQNINEGLSRVQVSIYTTGNKFTWAIGNYYVMVNAEKK